MDSESQADAVRQIEDALLALRPTHGRGPGRPGGGTPGMGGGPRGGHRPPWGDGPPPWAGGAGHGHGPHERGLGAGARFRLLEVLSVAAPDARLGISEIAEAVGVDQPRASRLVADAASRGLVTRSVDPLDARKSVVAITDAGRALLTTVRQGRRTAVTDALEGFTDDEVVAFASLLSRFAAAWPRH